MNRLIATALLLLAASGCNRHHRHAEPVHETDGLTPATFMATYEVTSVTDTPHTYGRKTFRLRRSSDDPRDGGRSFLSAEISPAIDPSLERAMVVGAKVNVIVLPAEKQEAPVQGYICPCGSLCAAKRGGICGRGCGCPIGH